MLIKFIFYKKNTNFNFVGKQFSFPANNVCTKN